MRRSSLTRLGASAGPFCRVRVVPAAPWRRCRAYDARGPPSRHSATMHVLRTVLLLLLVLAPGLMGQRIVNTHTMPFDRYVVSLRPAGDTDGDGVNDFVVVRATPSVSAFEVQVVSGASALPMHTIAGF